jgi:hypothetical protein
MRPPPKPSPAARERGQTVAFIHNVNRARPLSREAGEGQGGGFPRAPLTPAIDTGGPELVYAGPKGRAPSCFSQE